MSQRRRGGKHAFSIQRGDIMNAGTKQTEATRANARAESNQVSDKDLEKINAGAGICGPGPKYPGDGDYIMWGPGTPNFDPRTDGEVN